MSLTFIGEQKTPSYLALTTDISGSAIAGANIVGATVYITDTPAWYIIKPDLKLAPYFFPKLTP